jgi:hypothetical protein
MKYILLFCLLFFAIISFSRAALIETIQFDKPTSFSKVRDFDIIQIKGADLTSTPGNPQLPVVTKHYIIPENAVVTGVDIISKFEETLEGTFDIYPVQKPSILNIPNIDFKPAPWVEQNPKIYNSSKPFPEKCIEIGSYGNLNGYRLVSVNFYPFQYIPAKGIIKKINRITFKINYTPGTKKARMKRISKNSRQILQTLVHSMCENPQAIYDPFGDIDSDSTIDYVIITSSSLASNFQPLSDWKTQKGVNSMIVTTDSIYANCPGSDNQEKIRNFIKDANINWGTIWILLAGDTDIVPSRVAFAMASEAGVQPEDEDSLHADLYYSDLDGTWNYNGTPPYGEVADCVDLYPDVFVGRAPVSTITEVNTFVNKIITYETNPPSDYELNILFMAMILWSDPYTDGGLAKDLIDSLYIPDRFSITKLYQSWGNLNKNNVIVAINEGQNLLNHNGHAWWYIMSMGSTYVTNDDFDNLTNGDRQGILYSIGCWANAFDYDAISEHFVNNPNGGGVAFIGNSRYGWGSPGNPCFGYSDRFDAAFYNMLIYNQLTNVGYALAMDKAYYIPRSRQENVYRWHQYQINLLGDPEMPVWTDTPQALSLYHPDTLQNGMEITVVVRDNQGKPVKNALVCLMKDPELYERAYTNNMGEFKTTVSISSPGIVELTVTGTNFLPKVDSLYTKLAGPYLAYKEHSIQDNISGNDDGLLNPGESAYLIVDMKNYGTQSLSDPSTKLSSEELFVTLLDSVHNYTGTVDPQSSILCTFALSVSGSCENGEVAKLNFNVNSPQGNWTSFANEKVTKPILFVNCDSLHDQNSNGIPEPGENVDIFYSLINWGYGFGYDVNCNFSTSDTYISITGGANPSWTTVYPESSETGTFSFNISSSCPDPHFAAIDYSISTTEGYTFPGSLLVSIGELGFWDDMESDTTKWTHSGQNDEWHISSYRKHSGNNSWYCGIEGSHTYVSNANAQLISIPFNIGPNTHLKLWHWYEFTNYGSDGMYVIIKREYSSDTLDFIGSGGKLDSLLNTWNDWLPEDYDLSYLPAGEEIQLVLSFISDDADVAEGIYVDDVNIKGDEITGEKEIEFINPVFTNGFSVRPIPMKNSSFIFLSSQENSEVSLKVYNVSGRKVKTILDGHMKKGERTIKWNGKNDRGKELPQGIYFLRMEIPDQGFSQSKKIVLVR